VPRVEGAGEDLGAEEEARRAPVRGVRDLVIKMDSAAHSLAPS
jgi:hypothetical protein